MIRWPGRAIERDEAEVGAAAVAGEDPARTGNVSRRSPSILGGFCPLAASSWFYPIASVHEVKGSSPVSSTAHMPLHRRIPLCPILPAPRISVCRPAEALIPNDQSVRQVSMRTPPFSLRPA